MTDWSVTADHAEEHPSSSLSPSLTPSSERIHPFSTATVAPGVW